MRKFCSNQQILQALNNSSDITIQQMFHPFLNSVGSLKHEELPELSVLSLSNIEVLNESCKLIPPLKEAVFVQMNIQTLAVL